MTGVGGGGGGGGSPSYDGLLGQDAGEQNSTGWRGELKEGGDTLTAQGKRGEIKVEEWMDTRMREDYKIQK